MWLYSGSTGAFYLQGYSHSVPNDAVEISDEEKQRLMQGESSGLLIVADKKGRPTLAERPELSDQEKQSIANLEAKEFLARTDWYVTRMAETGQEIPSEVLDARAKARASVVGVE